MSRMSESVGRCLRGRRRVALGGRASIVLAIAVAALALASCGASPSVSPTTAAVGPPGSVPSYSGPGWILSGDAFQGLAGNPAAKVLFDNPRTLVNIGGDSLSVLAGWKVTPFVSFRSYADMQQAFASGSIPAGVKVVMYDNEHWQYTPLDEQEDPAKYEQLAAQLIHAHGMKFLATPAADLAAFLDAGHGLTEFQAYLALDLAGQAAKYADILNIQAQGEESDASAYAAFLKSAIAQARAVNPNIVIYAGISTARSSDPNAMFNAVQATQGVVTGYWLNVITSKGRNAFSLADGFVNSFAAKLHAS
jgi:hypothetical protein